MKFITISKLLAQCHVGIAGAGGLGSNCAAALVRCGLGQLTIADFDQVEISNLNRQYYFYDQLGMPKVEALAINLKRINPDIRNNGYEKRLDPVAIEEIFSKVDLLVEAFDLAEEKVMLIETALGLWPQRPVIVGSGMAGLADLDRLHIRQSGNLYICGDESSEISLENPPNAPRVAVVANMQADLVIRLLYQKNHLIK